MINKKISLISFVLLIAFIIAYKHLNASAGEENLPQAPPGYSWKWCESIQAGFLLPDGWFFKEEEREGTKAIFITKESIETEGIFRTGFSANIIQNASKKTGMPPSEYAKQFIDNLKSITQSHDIGPIGDGVYFKGYGGFFRSESKELGKIIQYTLVMGNDKTGALYIFIFESPEAEWNQAWKIGATIMDNLALETEF